MEERIPSANTDQPAPLSMFLLPVLLLLKKHIIERCHLLSPLKWLSWLSGSAWLRLKVNSRPAGFHYNHDIPDKERKLSFSYCAFPANSFCEVVTEGLDFVKAYKLKHGFEPHALAIYFVEQSGKRLAGGYHRKENVKGDTHTFAFDPVHGYPKDPEWHKFLDTFHLWQKSKGGTPSITQSFRVEHQDLEWGSKAVCGTPSPRFTNAYLQQFFDAKKDTNI